MIQRVLLSVFCILLILLPLGSTECTMDDFLRCDREIQSKQSPIKISISCCSKFYLKFPNFSFDSSISTTDLRSIGGVCARDDAGGVADLPQRHHQHRRRGRLRALLLCSVPGLLLIKLKTAERRTLWIVKWLVTMTLREHPESDSRVVLSNLTVFYESWHKQ